MSRLLTFIGAVVITFGSALAGYYFYRSNSSHESPPQAPAVLSSQAALHQQGDVIGMPRPAFFLPDVSGRVRHISEWDGMVIALNFWATWCPPCLQEIPGFIELQEKYADRGLQFIGIALQRAEEVTEFMQTHGMNYPVLAGELEVIKMAQSYGNHIGALPYTVIIDRDGKIAYIKHGLLEGRDAEEIISGLL